ncbi:hypothetical protein GJAV_G00163960 [Gymnothorax javanicus]|nr:hypothetical protein GJAV_G00163960 [Gymnothorax javanicus]
MPRPATGKIPRTGAALPTYRSKRQLHSSEETQLEEDYNPLEHEDDGEQKIAEGSILNVTEDNQKASPEVGSYRNPMNESLRDAEKHSILSTSLTNLGHNIPQDETVFTGSGDGGPYSSTPQNNSEINMVLLDLSGEPAGSGDGEGGSQKSLDSNSSSYNVSSGSPEKQSGVNLEEHFEIKYFVPPNIRNFTFNINTMKIALIYTCLLVSAIASPVHRRRAARSACSENRGRSDKDSKSSSSSESHSSESSEERNRIKVTKYAKGQEENKDVREGGEDKDAEKEGEHKLEREHTEDDTNDEEGNDTEENNDETGDEVGEEDDESDKEESEEGGDDEDDDEVNNESGYERGEKYEDGETGEAIKKLVGDDGVDHERTDDEGEAKGENADTESKSEEEDSGENDEDGKEEIEGKDDGEGDNGGEDSSKEGRGVEQHTAVEDIREKNEKGFMEDGKTSGNNGNHSENIEDGSSEDSYSIEGREMESSGKSALLK